MLRERSTTFGGLPKSCATLSASAREAASRSAVSSRRWPRIYRALSSEEIAALTDDAVASRTRPGVDGAAGVRRSPTEANGVAFSFPSGTARLPAVITMLACSVAAQFDVAASLYGRSSLYGQLRVSRVPAIC